MPRADQPKTVSEQLFERYLDSQGSPPPEYEPMVEGSPKRPDYRVLIEGATVYFEVKEFEPQPQDFALEVDCFDPYGPIRQKINAAAPQFKNLKGTPCAVVLFNAGRPLVMLEPETVFGAMLGNLGIKIPFDPEAAMFDDTAAEPAFLGGGKMLWYGPKSQPIKPINTTVSAVITLEQFAVGRRKGELYVASREHELHRRLEMVETFNLLCELPETIGLDLGETVLRAVVHENPYATARLPAAFGRGPFDERYGTTDGKLGRIFVGRDLAQLELAERELNMQQGLL